jgi:ribosomal protein RSM22 (predicted rRNA methylase)
MLDLGAGPGTATWAAHDRCDHLGSALLVDRSAALLGIATRLAAAAGVYRAIDMTTRVDDIGARRTWPAADLVIAAYALAELPDAGRASLLASAWSAASLMLVLVEPGTPAGFAHLHEARTRLLAEGAHVLAPCPHEQGCPMRSRPGDWCHFAVRVPRTRRHRQLKGGTLGYEDEKFACLVVSREALSPIADARVLRHPRVEKGRTGLTLCTRSGLEQVTVTKREASYRAARKADWGDAWRDAPGPSSDDD